MASNIIGNRNSTPEAKPQHRPLRAVAPSNLRSSADMSSFTSPLSARNIRPASEVLYNQQSQNAQDDSGKLGEQWLQDIEQYEVMLEEMAQATLDSEFKDELSAIEQWFHVLSEAERTAATYALIQQTTQMQQRFFAQVLNQMSKSHPISGVLSPANFGEKDPMSSRMSDAMAKLSMENRNSMSRMPVSPGVGAGSGAGQRSSVVDPSAIEAMFPDAAAAIAKQKAEYAQHTGNPIPNRASQIGDRLSVPASARDGAKSESMSQNWRSEQRPKSSDRSGSGQTPMGQFAQPPPSAGLRSPRVQDNIQTTTLSAPSGEMPILSPYNVGNQSWASMSNTPMVPSFNLQQSQAQSDMIANATAMKLAALSTVNNRIALDDVRKFQRDNRRPRSTEPRQPATPTSIPGINTIMVNDQGQVLNAQQIAALQAQQFAANQGRRSRPNSPGFALNGYLGPMGLAPPTFEGYLSDHSDARGRSPRGRRGSSKPPEDPTDPKLLDDIPNWLRSLRLHKYTDNLKDMSMAQLIQLDEKGLEAKGVNALGARNKLLKAFEQIRESGKL